MPPIPRPWFRKDRKQWYVDIDRKRYRLGPDKIEAHRKYHALMALPTRRRVAGDSLVNVLDLFLSWTQKNRSPGTYRIHRHYLQSFVKTVPPGLAVDELQPFHVQEWVDSKEGLTANGKRSKIRTIKRALNWARRMGHVSKNVDPLALIEMPQAERREKVITQAEYDAILSHYGDDPFADVIRIAWETGARPQEIRAVAARHVDLTHPRWVFPQSEAKGRRRPRIVFLSELAEEITRRRMERFPEGPLFRNEKGTPWKKDAFNCRFSRLRKTLSEKYCLYHFRHTFATRKLKEGLDPLTVAELLGHSDPSMLAKVYQHLAHDPQHMLRQLRRSAAS